MLDTFTIKFNDGSDFCSGTNLNTTSSELIHSVEVGDKVYITNTTYVKI